MKAYGTEEAKKVEESFEERLIRVEAQIAEFKNLKAEPGPTGPRGPAGPIEAAVASAREATKQDLADTLKKSEDLHRAVSTWDSTLESRVRHETDKAAVWLRESNDSFKANIEDQVATIVIKILQEYFVLDSECRVLDHLQRPPVKGGVS
jgi:hypothetical protein